MPFLGSSKKPDPELLHHLERIAGVKDSLPQTERGACNALGLYVQVQTVFRKSTGGDFEQYWKDFVKNGPKGTTILQAGSQTTSFLDAWKRGAFVLEDDEWRVEKYEPGSWERLVEPSVRLAEWLHEWGGLDPYVVEAYRDALAEFESTGELCLALRASTDRHLCGKCGAEVTDILDHVKHVHKGWSCSVEVGSHGTTVGVWNGESTQLVERALYESSTDNPYYSLGLAANITGVIRKNGGRFIPDHGVYPVPDDITDLPALARALRHPSAPDPRKASNLPTPPSA